MADPHTGSKTPALTDDARWAAVLARDSGFDGRFYYSVASTGIYCRPSCPARRPRRDRVGFHESAAEAEAAGFRACRRCKPHEASPELARKERIAKACRLIEAAEEPPSLAALAEAVGLSPYHFHRQFKAELGVTPKAYAAAHRTARVRAALSRGATVTEAIYEAGYNSTGRFYANAKEALGMTPQQFRSGGADHTIKFSFAASSLGPVLIAASEKGICAVMFGETHDALLQDLEKQFPRARLMQADSNFEAMTAKVIDLIETPGVPLDLPLDIRGTAFQHRVWEALRNIPPGATASYTEIAARIGMPSAARAVARACASNPIAVAIPCHRVVRADGALSGYRWGVSRKAALLAEESK